MGHSFDDLYEIWVKEPIDPSWSDWLDDFEISCSEGMKTRISGRIKDKTALYGLLDRMRDLNLTILCVRRLG